MPTPADFLAPERHVQAACRPRAARVTRSWLNCHGGRVYNPHGGRESKLSKDDAPPDSERIAYLEEELKGMKKKLELLTEQLFGSITILCLPLPRGKRLELGFKQVERLPNGTLAVIVKRYISESRTSDLNFDDMLSPLVAVFGFERAWKIIGIDHLRDTYGDYAVLRWEEMAKSHPCEG